MADCTNRRAAAGLADDGANSAVARWLDHAHGSAVSSMKAPAVRANHRWASSRPSAGSDGGGANASDITASRFCPRTTDARRPRLHARVMLTAKTARRSAPNDDSNGRLMAVVVRSRTG